MPQLNGKNNVLLTDDVIAKEALRLLINNTRTARIASKRYEGEFATVGQTISVQMPARVKSASGATLVKQPMVKRVEPLTIDRQEHVGIEYSVRDRLLSLGDFSDQILKAGMIRLGNVIDRSALQALYYGGFNTYGTPGTAATVDDAINMGARAEETGFPRDGNSFLALKPLDGAKFAIDLKGTYNEDFVHDAVREAAVGRIDDLDVYRSANVYNHTVGALGGTPAVNGASQSGSSLITDGWTAAAAARLKKGDVFTIANVFAVNPQTYESTGRLQEFVVTADVSSDGSGNATIPISPAINSGAQTTVDAAGNNISTAAYQNVDSLPADNALLTIKGTASTSYRQGIMFHRDALALAIPPLPKLETPTKCVTVRDPETGIGLQMTAAYDITNHTEIWRIDVIWGVKGIYPELIWRLWSAVATA